MKLSSKPKIIINRTDNIGDVVLTLPLAKAIKELYPSSEITFLGKGYIKPLIDACENIDSFISWDDLRLTTYDLRLLKDYEVILHVFPRPEIARMAYKAGIKYRIGTSHRYYHWLYCNKLVNFTRKNSLLHEAQLNFKLAEPLINEELRMKNEELKTTNTHSSFFIHHSSLNSIGRSYGLTNIPKLDAEWKNQLDKNKFNLIIHPLSRGSSRNWNWKNYNKLIEILPADQYKIFITGAENESNQIIENIHFSSLPKAIGTEGINHPQVIDMTGKLSFAQLIAFINKADGLVAASTGPLHIAAALGKTAIGLYPSVKPMHPGRWAPLGPKASYLALNKDCSDCKKGGSCHCINSISPEQVKEQLMSDE